ncbi:MAG: LysR family transcriptional regulator [Nocardioides sp.]
MDVETRQLRYFVAVAEELHFGRAAARLHMAQPQLSQAIQALEATLSARLLDRTTRRVALTPAGTAYLHHARQTLAHLERAAADARRLASGLEGRLIIGCVGSASYSLLPRLARALRAERPGLEIDVRGEMLTGDQARALRDGSIDLAITRRPLEPAGLDLTVLRSDRLMLAVADDHRLALRRRVTWSDLAGESLVVHEGGGRSHMHSVISAALAASGVALSDSQEVAETSTALTFVAAGLGVAVLPEPAQALGLPGVRWVEIRPISRVDLLVAVRAETTQPAPLAARQVLQGLMQNPYETASP